MPLHYHINGQEPQLAGARCTGFVLQQFYESTQITDQVNVAYLRIEGQWYRMYFECETIFWRESEPPEAAQNSTLDHGLILNDLSELPGVVGHSITHVAYGGSESGDVYAKIEFSSGKHLKFSYSCDNDATEIAG